MDRQEAWRKFVRRCWWQFDGEAEEIMVHTHGFLMLPGITQADKMSTLRRARRRILALKTRVLIRLDRAALKYFYDRPD